MTDDEAHGPASSRPENAGGRPDGVETAAFERLLDHVTRVRCLDLSGYERPGLVKRISHRARALGFESLDDYRDHLEANPAEFAALFDSINVDITPFFRDRDSWTHLSTHVLPDLLLQADPEVRVWSAGCAGGQEAYTLAMTLCEAMGIEQFRERVKIYATDVDTDALAYATAAVYSEREMRSVPGPLKDKYFDSRPSGMTFRGDLRHCVVFGRNDLTHDATIPRIDLLACRNTLPYFDSETQSRILSRLTTALKPAGVLLLGRVEVLPSSTTALTPLDADRRIFRRRAVSLDGPQVLAPGTPPTTSVAPPDALQGLRADAFAASPVAQLILDADGTLVVVNGSARELTGLDGSDVGRRFRDLVLSLGLDELRPALEQVRQTRETRRLGDVRWTRDRAGRYLEVELVPLSDVQGGYAGTLVSIRDTTRVRQLHEELERTTSQLRAASDELRSTNEELETTNGELHSTVEALDTMNDELRSVDDELLRANEEARDRASQLAHLQQCMRAVLGGMPSAVIAVDHRYSVRVWSSKVEGLFGVSSDDVLGADLLRLDVGLPTDALEPLLRAVLEDPGATRSVAVDAVDRRGRRVALSVTVSALVSHEHPTGILLLIDGGTYD